VLGAGVGTVKRPFVRRTAATPAAVAVELGCGIDPEHIGAAVCHAYLVLFGWLVVLRIYRRGLVATLVIGEAVNGA
jgi:hypothetical protein